MASYAITFARSARKELQRLETSMARRVLTKIETLAANPRRPGSVKIRGQTGLWRDRVGDYRIIYSIDDAQRVIDIVAVRPRREAYR